MTKNTIQSVKIINIVDECPDVKTFTLDILNTKFNQYLPRPGQFVMLWVPGIDEVPMSISNITIKGNWQITVKNVGECTSALHEMKIKDYIGIRGPLGNSFSIPKTKPLHSFLISGGFGTAPLRFLSLELLKRDYDFTIIQGAKSKSDLLFFNELNNLNTPNTSFYCTTEDGTRGTKGLATKQFKSELRKFTNAELSQSLVYTCGPEQMMYEIFLICEEKNIQLEASLERMMRCGCGLCGLCSIDPLGLLVCKDGPIFSSETLRKMEDFGKFKRDHTGKKIPL